MTKKDYPLCVKVPDKEGNFTRILKRHRFSDHRRPFYFEPQFMLGTQDKIIRKDSLFELDDVVGPFSAGFQPCSLGEYRNYCRQKFNEYKENEILINPFAVAAGMKEPVHSDKDITSPKYHV